MHESEAHRVDPEPQVPPNGSHEAREGSATVEGVQDLAAGRVTHRLDLAHAIAEGAALRPWEHLRMTQAQIDFLSDDRRNVLLRKGNQLGGTTALLVDLICRCRGIHPWQRLRHRPPINAILASESWDQMGMAGSIMHKLWDLLPKDEIDPKIEFEPGRGITGKPPRIVFVAGPGKGSVISFATFRQGGARLAGATVHVVASSEPPPGSVLAEIVPRLLRHGGDLRLDFTPVVDMPDQTELQQMVAKGSVAEHNPHLVEANCWPVGAPFPWITQADIDAMTALLPRPSVGMRVRGDWEPVVTGNWLSAFNEERHVRRDSPPEGATLGIGIDHGAQAGKQAAVLFAASDLTELHPYVWFLDEDIGTGRTSVQEDAQAILRMLRRNGLGWRDVDVWVGDRATTVDRLLVIKDNAKLRDELAQQVKVAPEAFARIETARKGAGSVEHGLRKWNGLLATTDSDGTPHMVLHPRCIQTIAFCKKWAGKKDDPLKNPGDAARYVLNRVVESVGAPSGLLQY